MMEGGITWAAPTAEPSAMRPRTAALWITCLGDVFFPGIGLAAARILASQGVRPEFPEGQTCCGQPAFNAGFCPEARSMALHFLEVFEGAECIVSPSGSCVSMVRCHYPGLFDGDRALRERFEALGRRTFELSEFLTEVLRIGSTGARFPHRVTYHDSCHSLRSLGLRDGPRRLLRAVEGVELLDLASSETCCGFGGVFSVKYPEISMAMCSDKVARIEESGAEYVVATDASCLMHIGGALQRRGSKVKTLHLAEILAAGL